ncbi:hypothetical protein [Streptomyces sp. MMS24-I29]|uniref:hypothetical protein n=1 Tax=Streptomyces sp. MMS24-I29 TaxID=3351480 RepID=UPI003C798D74
MDEHVALAISNETKCQPPFSSGVLDSVKYLHVSYARSLEGLQSCPNLEILQLIGCEIDSLDPIRNLGALFTLNVRLSSLADLTGVVRLPELTRINAELNRIEDLEPLLSLPGESLSYLKVNGNPLSDDSYRRVVPELKKRVRRVFVSDEAHWLVGLELRRRGLPYAVYKAHDGTRLCRPGLEPTGLPNLPDQSHPIVSLEEIQDLLKSDTAAITELFSCASRMPTTFGP